MSRYQRLELQPVKPERPGSKRQEKSKRTSERNQELMPHSSLGHSSPEDLQHTNDDNFEQYSVPQEEENVRGGDKYSIEDSFNQYENLDKFLENDRRKEERRQFALKQI